MIDGFQQSFREEAYDLLNGLEESLLELEESPDDREAISAVFRAMHTIKGSAGMFGFEGISSFAHHVETTLDEVRAGRLRVSQPLIDLTLECRDHIRLMLDEPDDPSIPQRSKDLEEQLERRIHGEGAPREAGRPPRDGVISDDGRAGAERVAPQTASDRQVMCTWRLEFDPHADFMANGSNPLLLLAELATLGECSVHPDVSSIPDLESFDPAVCSVTWEIYLTSDRTRNEIRDVFMFVEDACSLSMTVIDEDDGSGEAGYKPLGQILIERGVVDRPLLDQALSGQRRIGEVLVESGVDRHAVESALEEQEHVRRARQKAQQDSSALSIRVQSDKLDELVDLVGELVTLQARFGQTAAQSAAGEVVSIAENFERLIAELRDHTMSIRMVPIGSAFSRFRRLIRDLSRELGKEIELETSGGETELDKTVIERLHDPLVHLVRNCIDHGIEEPEERQRAGKPARGTVRLAARHVGAHVEVEVADDGKGLDHERVRRRAAERGLISGDAQLSETEVLDLVFAAGFSTAETVTSVSGRGVGMDVVRRQLDSIGGSVKLTSELGRGTTVLLQIPLTLAIIDGLLVRIADERFVIPLSNVEECIEYRRDNGQKGDVVANRGALLPLVDLRRMFAVGGARPEIEQAVVVGTSNGRVGFVVDAVIGDHQTVIKNLGRVYQQVEGVSGATILGDGAVALILDVQRLATGRTNGGQRAQ